MFKANSEGYGARETSESFRQMSIDTLRYIVENTYNKARRQLALDEIERRK